MQYIYVYFLSILEKSTEAQKQFINICDISSKNHIVIEVFDLSYLDVFY